MNGRLLDALADLGAVRADLRVERRWQSVVLQRGSHLELATQSFHWGALARAMGPRGGWGAATADHPDRYRPALRRALERSLATAGRESPIPAPLPARVLEMPPPPPGRDPRAVPLARKVELVRRAAEALRSADRRIVEWRVRYEDVLVERWVATSDGGCLCEWRPDVALSVLAVAQEQGTVEHALDSVAVAGDWDALERWVDQVAATARRAVALLRARPCTPGRRAVVLDPGMAGALVHRVAGHLCAADDVEDGAAALVPGQRIGPACLTVGDDGAAPGLRGTATFDDEGVPPSNTVLIRNGVVTGALHTRTTAAALGVAVTGHARADGLAMPAARPTNTYLAAGSGTLADLLDGMSDGIYLACPLCLRLEGSRLAVAAGLARRIRNGTLDEPIKGAVLEGPVRDLLAAVDRVAADFAWARAAARCARGGAGSVPVSTGAPHVRLSDVVIAAAT